MTATEPSPACLTVYHDGSCPLCRREIALARKVTEETGVAFVDVSSARSGDVAPGLSPSAAMRRFHVRCANGELLSGAAAFLELWSRAPRLAWLVKVARRPLLVRALDRIYGFLLVIRPAVSAVVRRIER